jgi:K+-transporting ATPase A subunit
MSANGWLQLALYLIVLLLLVKPLGTYMAAVFEGRGAATRLLQPLERALYRLCYIEPKTQMNWKQYAAAMLRWEPWCSMGCNGPSLSCPGIRNISMPFRPTRPSIAP